MNQMKLANEKLEQSHFYQQNKYIRVTFTSKTILPVMSQEAI
jgi:hypothetical protein